MPPASSKKKMQQEMDSLAHAHPASATASTTLDNTGSNNSSDLSALSTGNNNPGLFDQEPNPFEQSFSGPGQPPRSSSRATVKVEEETGHLAVKIEGKRGSKAKDAAASNDSSSTPSVDTAAPSSGLPGTTNGISAIKNNVRTPAGSTAMSTISRVGPFPSAVQDLSGANFGWESNSLRSGPLSPSLLSGPAHQQPQQQPQHISLAGSSGSLLYDPAAILRTNLQPLSGPGNSAFPPPSPATAALFAMMTNNTPGSHMAHDSSSSSSSSALAGGGPRPHEGPNEGNQFDTSFGRATGAGLRSMPSSLSQHYQPHPQDGYAGGRLISSSSNGGGYITHQQPHHLHHQQQQQQHQQAPRSTNGAPNPLYLLSQAQDDSEDAVVAANALNNLGGPGYTDLPQSITPTTLLSSGSGASAVYGDSIRTASSELDHGRPLGGGAVVGMKLAPATSSMHHHTITIGQAVGTAGLHGAAAAESSAAASSPKANGKRKKSANAMAADDDSAQDPSLPPLKKGRKGKGKAATAKSPAAAPNANAMDEFDHFEDQDGSGSEAPEHDPNETEEQKRRNFLERNRQAALKCRQRKKAWLGNLQSKVEYLTADNDTLQSTIGNLKEEIISLRSILSAHASCPIAVDVAAVMGQGTR